LESHLIHSFVVEVDDNRSRHTSGQARRIIVDEEKIDFIVIVDIGDTIVNRSRHTQAESRRLVIDSTIVVVLDDTIVNRRRCTRSESRRLTRSLIDAIFVFEVDDNRRASLGVASIPPSSSRSMIPLLIEVDTVDVVACVR
jgi:hypothetical protein